MISLYSTEDILEISLVNDKSVISEISLFIFFSKICSTIILNI